MAHPRTFPEIEVGASLNGVNYSDTASFTINQSCLNPPLGDAAGLFGYATTCRLRQSPGR